MFNSIKKEEKKKQFKSMLIPIEANPIPQRKLNREEKKIAKKELKETKKVKINERRAICQFYEQWVKLMAHMGIYNKLNQTITPKNIEVKPYGFKCDLHYVQGVSLTKLETDLSVKTIEEDFQCLFITYRASKSNKMEAVFMQKSLSAPAYEPVKLKPYQVYMSMNIEFQALMADMLKYPHIFITGASNMGKTKFIDAIILNLVNNCTPDEVEFYILQCDKHDQRAYIRLPHTKCYANTIEDMCIEICYVKDKMQEINDMLMPYIERMECTNIFEFNDLIDKGVIKHKKKFPCRYIVIDEYASLMPEGETNKHLKECKEIIQTRMEEIIRLGRSAGIYVIIATQRGTIDMVPSFVKAMCATNITFKVNNKKSEELTGFTGAIDLEQREFICVATDLESKRTSTYFGTTPFLSPEVIKTYIKEYLEKPPILFPFERYKETYLPSPNKKSKNKNILDKIQNIPTNTTTPNNDDEKKKEVENKKYKNMQNTIPKDDELEKVEKIKDKVRKKLGPFYDPNYKDPTTDPNVTVKDETPMSKSKNSTNERPAKINKIK